MEIYVWYQKFVLKYFSRLLIVILLIKSIKLGVDCFLINITIINSFRYFNILHKQDSHQGNFLKAY